MKTLRNILKSVAVPVIGLGMIVSTYAQDFGPVTGNFNDDSTPDSTWVSSDSTNLYIQDGGGELYKIPLANGKYTGLVLDSTNLFVYMTLNDGSKSRCRINFHKGEDPHYYVSCSHQ